MNKQELTDLMKSVTFKRMSLMEGKRHDYANEDALSNFKRVHIICSILDIDPRRSPVDCAKFLAVLKFDRWCNLSRKKTEPKNESVQDTIEDLHNYLDLAYACEIEENNEKH